MQTSPYDLDSINKFVESNYGGWRYLIYPDGYTVTFLALAPAGVSTGTLNISGNADFVMLGIKHRANVAIAAQTISSKTAPFVRILLTDAGSNEQTTKQSVDLENYSTNGGDSRMLPYPRIFQARTAVTVQATNYSGTETYNLDVFFEGVQVKILGPAAQ